MKQDGEGPVTEQSIRIEALERDNRRRQERIDVLQQQPAQQR